MSVEKVVAKIDYLLSVFNETDKRASSSKESGDHGAAANVTYFSSIDAVKEGMNVRVTADPKFLGKLWDESGLGPMDELESLCNVVGTVQEIETSDNTVELRWENYDTAWVPVKACSDAGDSKPTLPGLHTSWLSPDKDENKDNDENTNEEQPQTQDTQVKYFESIEDTYIKQGAVVTLTDNLDLLEKHWEEAKEQLGENNYKYEYLSKRGPIIQTNEDYDTIQVQFSKDDAIWVPVQACFASPDQGDE